LRRTTICRGKALEKWREPIERWASFCFPTEAKVVRQAAAARHDGSMTVQKQEVAVPKLRQHQTNPEWENGYRRGYMHGVSATIEAIGHLLPEAAQAKMNVWISRELRRWQMDPSPDFEPPPFPSME
jgi:hypothetical protein